MMTNYNTGQLELLNLKVGTNDFAIDIKQVRKIRVIGTYREIPNLPNGWIGVIDFRKTIVPIVDLRIALAGENPEITPKTVMVLVQVIIEKKPIIIGLVVDAVSDVVSIKSEDIRSSPNLANLKNDALKGMFKFSDRIVVILDIEKLALDSNFQAINDQLDASSEVL